jgi:hypothetical protein
MTLAVCCTTSKLSAKSESIAVVQVDVVRRRATSDKPNGLANHKGHGFGLCLAYRLGGGGAPFGLVHHLVRCFMYQRGELLGLRLTGKNSDASAVAHPHCGGNLRVVDNLDALVSEEGRETVDALAGVAGNFAQLRQVYAVGLRYVEDVGIAETKQGAGVLLGDVLFGFLVLLATDADDRSKNADALRPCIDGTAKVLPRPKPCNAGSLLRVANIVYCNDYRIRIIVQISRY